MMEAGRRRISVLPTLPAFSAHDCRFLRRFEGRRKPFERLPAADQTYLRDIRARLQALARKAVDDYRGRVAMLDFASPLNPQGFAAEMYSAGIFPRLGGDDRPQRSAHLQLAVSIMPEGFEISFGRGGRPMGGASPEKAAIAKEQLENVMTALMHLRVPLVAHIERTLRPDWIFRKHGMSAVVNRDFSTLTQWLEFAASDAGARASISMFIGVDEIENSSFDIAANFLEASRLFEPFFEAVYGSGEMVLAAKPLEKPAMLEVPEPPIRDLSVICDDFAVQSRMAHLVLGRNHEENIRAFIASLATKRFVILTGLSGSGKTQLALRFGDWLGIDRVRVTPVRPDWTGAEALFGYEDALQPARDGARAWHVPDALEFMLRAANDPDQPYLIVLDEMNLAHVERYFADFLSGMETSQPCLPNLERGDDGHYRVARGAEPKLPIPTNLFVIGTVNIDETTYLFSPKVLDRANTIDFRVRTEDLQIDDVKPVACQKGPNHLVRGFLSVSTDERFHVDHPAPGRERFAEDLRRVHSILSEHNLEFGHRVFYEAMRFAAMFAACGTVNPHAALDRQIMQKILPRLHGSRRKLELALSALAAECIDWGLERHTTTATTFDPLATQQKPVLMPLSFDKIRRMVRALRLNQFTSFTE